jgi:pilus assembly protein CpaB
VVSRSVTFEVDSEQAQKLALGAQVGQLSLALRNVGDDAEEAVRRITIDDLAPPKIQPKPETPAASNDRAPASVETVPRSHRPEREEAEAAQYAEILARIAKLERHIQDLKALLTSDH